MRWRFLSIPLTDIDVSMRGPLPPRRLVRGSGSESWRRCCGLSAAQQFAIAAVHAADTILDDADDLCAPGRR
jgi:hypothetical protein